ncbi:UDP-glucose 4-epimerase GalE [Niveispirillum cyanobacteriorum]|uniref:UDP-glucose 4-epimerase n=1 Tax=Niveispirillum cyanobacteriorum TaxID=1612173 RepID=A0A2K9NNK3_9PROT|nr:UDP-glucose 4-epimerase GalE [Niveispirillum cyanobacteriorum]AUN33925.1 UDP-glucose 4-epimerase GalE [Niveispirillum cyanobacteriorum]GGE86066.1 UDP-glucose 4-epimerase GalE [Niveispirillum cyanobacteriorum]
MDTVLVTGGAGYIGSHAVLALRAAGRAVVVLDDLSTGDRNLIPADVPMIVGDVADTDRTGALLRDHRIGTVMHFAGSIIVPESVADPLKYYRNNTAASRSLIETCIKTGVGRFIFSSTAAVYGNPPTRMVTEQTPVAPVSPYGWSKLMTEQMLADVAAAHQAFRYIALRYFNVAGADPQGRAGQVTPNATHLIKLACETALGRRKVLNIFGSDYPTPDGTCIRDYIHVSDLADAHVCALNHLEKGGNSLVLNCGYGRGYSVRQVAEAVDRAAGRPLPKVEAPRRIGDPVELVADSTRLRDLLGWRPRVDDLDLIVSHALAWERR